MNRQDYAGGYGEQRTNQPRRYDMYSNDGGNSGR